MIVYVDGFNLYHGMKSQFGRAALWLDLVAMSKSFRPNQHLVAVKYFTAPVLDNPEGQSRQAHYQRALGSLYPGVVHIVNGRYQSRSVRCIQCGHEYTRYEEKETDVNIATALVSDAALHLMDTAIIVSADSDLAPAVRAARSIRPTLFVTAAFPPRRSSAELKNLMPASFRIGRNKIVQCQLPDQFEVDGQTHGRPDYWR